MKDPAVPLNFAIFLHNRKQSEEAKKMLHLFEIRVQKLRTTPGLDADPDVLQAASNLADKMEHTLSISVPKPATGSKQRRESAPESAKSIRKSALKSARAAGKNKLIIGLVLLMKNHSWLGTIQILRNQKGGWVGEAKCLRLLTWWVSGCGKMLT